MIGFPENLVSRAVRGAAFRLAVGLFLASGVIADSAPAAEAGSAPFRVGFSSSMFIDVNENDAKAAVKVWGQTAAKERGVPTDPDSMIFKDTPALLKAMRNKQVDAVGITITEYDVLVREVRLAPVFVTYNAGRVTEQCVLLAHQNGKIESLADLRGRSLAFHLNAQVCLGRPWLDTLLLGKGLKPAAEFAGKITQKSKLSKTVLPVFFRQSDACVVTRRGFETMCELNPQVGRQLKIIASSAEMVQAVFCIRADYAPPFKQELFAGLRDLHKMPAGQQVLTIFHSEKIEDQPVSCLDSALELLATHRRLTGSAGVSNSTRTVGMSQLTGEAHP